jgi:shikimate kinase
MSNPPQNTDAANLYLVGFMGTGKSAVGRLVAHRMGMQLIDSDTAIEHRAGKPITAIFADEGEETFRRYEREFIEGGHPATGCVVSCGGGLVLQEGMSEKLRERGIVVCLSARAETILERTQGNSNRPLLNVEDPLARINEMLEKRMPVYRAVGTEVLTDGRTISDIATHVQRVYHLEGRDFKPRAQ